MVCAWKKSTKITTVEYIIATYQPLVFSSWVLADLTAKRRNEAEANFFVVETRGNHVCISRSSYPVGISKRFLPVLKSPGNLWSL
jgi:hypothetical protein